MEHSIIFGLLAAVVIATLLMTLAPRMASTAEPGTDDTFPDCSPPGKFSTKPRTLADSPAEQTS